MLIIFLIVGLIWNWKAACIVALVLLMIKD